MRKGPPRLAPLNIRMVSERFLRGVGVMFFMIYVCAIMGVDVFVREKERESERERDMRSCVNLYVCACRACCLTAALWEQQVQRRSQGGHWPAGRRGVACVGCPVCVSV